MKHLLFLLLPLTYQAQTVEQVWNYAHKIGIQHDHIVVAQSILETGWYKCTNCSLSHNNLFGFKIKGEYLKFCHWKESIDYYKSWQIKHYKGGEYYDFLKCIDFGSGNCHSYAANMETYIAKLEQILWKIWSC